MEQKQTKCFWPSGYHIRGMGSTKLQSVLKYFGVESPEIDALVASPLGKDNKTLQKLVLKLKREAHERGDCECPNAAAIRAGAGAVKGVAVPQGKTTDNW